VRILRIASIAAAIGSLITACVFGKTKTIDPSQAGTAPKSIYDIQLKTLDGTANLDLAQYKGKKILIVNTASKCGYTPQYAELQQLSEKFADKLIIIGCPCNQFMDQEPGAAAEIASFCQKITESLSPSAKSSMSKAANNTPSIVGCAINQKTAPSMPPWVGTSTNS